jgi:sugar phosphate isomerase/epimerase
MAKIGFSLTSLKRVLPLKALNIAREKGAEVVELFGDLPLIFRGIVSQDPEKIRKKAEEYNIILTLHLPMIDINIASLNDLIYESSIESIKRSLEYARRCGARLVVIHPGLVPVRNLFVILLAKRRLRKAIEKIISLSEKYNIKLAIENTALDERDLFLSVSEFKKFILSFNGKLSVCFDFGHARVSPDGLSKNWDELKPLISHIHIHDNNGKEDEHLPLGEGNIDFSLYWKELKNFDGTIVLEVNDKNWNNKGLWKSLEILKKL